MKWHFYVWDHGSSYFYPPSGELCLPHGAGGGRCSPRGDAKDTKRGIPAHLFH